MASPKRRGTARCSIRITEFSRPPHEQLEDILIEAGYFGRRRLFLIKFLDLRQRSIVEEGGYEALPVDVVEALLPLAKGLISAAIYEHGGYLLETTEALIAYYPNGDDSPHAATRRNPQLRNDKTFTEQAN